MFIIIGNDTKKKQVNIYDTVDMTQEWVSYATLKKGIRQGLNIKGLDVNNNIIFKAIDLYDELYAATLAVTEPCKQSKSLVPLLEVLKPYGLAETLEDIDIEYPFDIDGFRFNRINTRIDYDIEVLENIVKQDITKSNASPIVHNIATELYRYAKALAWNKYAQIDYIIRLDNLQYLVLLDSECIQIKLAELSPAIMKIKSTDKAYSYYIRQVKRAVKESGGFNKFSYKYYISKLKLYPETTTEDYLDNNTVAKKDIIFERS